MLSSCDHTVTERRKACADFNEGAERKSDTTLISDTSISSGSCGPVSVRGEKWDRGEEESRVK